MRRAGFALVELAEFPIPPDWAPVRPGEGRRLGPPRLAEEHRPHELESGQLVLGSAGQQKGEVHAWNRCEGTLSPVNSCVPPIPFALTRRYFEILACVSIFVAQPGFGAAAGTESPGTARGACLSEKSYHPAPRPRFAEIRDRLPSPVFEERPERVSIHWKIWELPFKNFHEPAPGSGYVSQFIDAQTSWELTS